MDERLERDLRVGLADLLDAVVETHPRWKTSPAAETVAAGARHGLTARAGLLWAAVLTGLLLAGMAAAAFVGSQLRKADVRPVQPPAAITIVDRASDILATTRAHALPTQATCPPGSNPDAPGPANQWRPSGAMAFDRHAGRIVLLGGDPRDPYGRRWTWTYDVCTNTWQRMSPADGLRGNGRLVYDADSDRTLAFLAPEPHRDPTEIWSYDLAADRWTKVGSFTPTVDPGTWGTTFYHDPSGLVVVYDGRTMWAFDVDTDTLAKVRQQPDPALPAGAGLPDGKTAFGFDAGRDLVVAVVVPYEDYPIGGSLPPAKWLVPRDVQGETWVFDTRTGSWRRAAPTAASDLIVCGVEWRGSTDCYPTDGRAVYDEASGLPLFMNRDSGGATPGRIDAFDAGQGVWRTLFAPTAGVAGWCVSTPPVYDPLNARIVCMLGGGADVWNGVRYPFAGVSAFSTATGQWRWLLEPLETAPSPVPGATPTDWGTPPPPDWSPVLTPPPTVAP